MSSRLERLLWIVCAVFVAALVLGWLLPDRSRLRAEATAAGARADSLELVLADERAVIQQLQDSAQRGSVAHEQAKLAADAGGRALEAGIQRARAAAADSLLELATARVELERLAALAERYRWLSLGERRAAELRILPLEAIAARVEVTFTAVEDLAAARRDQVEALEGLDSRWRRLLGVACYGSGAAGGAAVGAQLGAIGGAAIGAGVGVLLAAVSCAR
ncbi:MAG: hypothetical protein KF709_02555 [Gemmatimonadaceae bacterium]|nr:hypothetical protein [Gemmatimonadaceae bacterium]